MKRVPNNNCNLIGIKTKVARQSPAKAGISGFHINFQQQHKQVVPLYEASGLSNAQKVS